MSLTRLTADFSPIWSFSTQVKIDPSTNKLSRALGIFGGGYFVFLCVFINPSFLCTISLEYGLWAKFGWTDFFTRVAFITCMSKCMIQLQLREFSNIYLLYLLYFLPCMCNGKNTSHLFFHCLTLILGGKEWELFLICSLYLLIFKCKLPTLSWIVILISLNLVFLVSLICSALLSVDCLFF